MSFCTACGTELSTIVDKRYGSCYRCRNDNYDKEKQETERKQGQWDLGLGALPVQDLIDELIKRGWEEEERLHNRHERLHLIAPVDYDLQSRRIE